MLEKKCRITVFTPTYNRAYTLHRVWESLCRQTCKDFIWLIIDDGSQDETKKIVEDFKDKSDFEIEYHYKENGGRHTAVNYSYKFLRTEYVVTCDSDDELIDNAIESILNIWDSIPKEEYDRFWCISAREMNAETGEMVGKPYPKHINSLTGKKQRKLINKYPGEKHCCRKVAIHTQYKFPEYEDTKFVTENTVWCVINKKYDQYCVNTIIGKYHMDSKDSISNKGMHSETHFCTSLHSGVFYINETFDEMPLKKLVINLINISRCAMLTNTDYTKVMRSLNRWYKRVLVTFGYPISKVYIIIKNEKGTIKK